PHSALDHGFRAGAELSPLGLPEQPPDVGAEDVRFGRRELLTAEALHGLRLRLEDRGVLAENSERQRFEDGFYGARRDAQLELDDGAHARAEVGLRRGE